MWRSGAARLYEPGTPTPSAEDHELEMHHIRKILYPGDFAGRDSGLEGRQTVDLRLQESGRPG